jgi:hypothetical protein
MIGGTLPMLTGRHPELLDLEGFVDHTKEQNDGSKLCSLSIEKLFRRRKLLYFVDVGRKISKKDYVEGGNSIPRERYSLVM